MNKIFTISREYGSGGRLVAKALAEALQVPFYDREIIGMAAKETGLSENFIQQAERENTHSFLYNLYMSSQNLPVSDQVFIAESDIIKEIAQKGPCVITGRCADYVLRNDPRCINVFVHAPLEQRMARVEQEYGEKAEDYRAFVLKKDRARASYYNHFTTNKWGKCQNYHLSLDSSLGLDTLVAILATAAGREEAAQ